jgi:hypothetical protein
MESHRKHYYFSIFLLASLAILVAGTQGCSTSTPIPEKKPIRYTSQQNWDACMDEINAELFAVGGCGSGGCFDGAIPASDICKERVGYAVPSEAETDELIKQVYETGDTKVNKSYFDLYPPDHEVHARYGLAARTHKQRVDAEREATRRAIKLGVGSPEFDVIMKLGNPLEINRTVNKYGVRKQFIYPGGVYVYTEDGVVTGWQD